jgi:hypothetical protein
VRQSLSLLHALVGSPVDIAHALNQLGSEDTPREIRADELRYALAALRVDQITPTYSGKSKATYRQFGTKTNTKI